MMNLLYIALAGAFGAVSRYLVSGWVYQLCGQSFPYGTLAVNLIGCLVLGVVAQIGQTTNLIPEPARVAIAIGFLGALTTFSTFGYETLRQLEDGKLVPALANIAANVVLGVGAVWLGTVAARQLYGPG